MDNLSQKQKEHQIKYYMDTVKYLPTIKETYDWKQVSAFESMLKKYREPIQFVTLSSNHQK